MFHFRAIGLCLLFGLPACSAQAAGGLLPPASESLWPSLQARIAVQTLAASEVGLLGLAGARNPGGVQGGAMFGDYYFAQPSFGGFRATSGVLMGAQGGLPQLSAGQGTRLGLTVRSAAPLSAFGNDSSTTLPYLGIGFTSQATSGAWSLVADMGLVAESTSSTSLRRALGVQGLENARRELRLSPLLQVGWRYSF